MRVAVVSKAIPAPITIEMTKIVDHTFTTIIKVYFIDIIQQKSSPIEAINTSGLPDSSLLSHHFFTHLLKVQPSSEQSWLVCPALSRVRAYQLLL